MSASGCNSEGKSLMDNIPADASSTIPKKVIGSSYQGHNLNGISTFTLSDLNSDGVKSEASALSREGAKFPSPMEVDEMDNVLHLTSTSALTQSTTVNTSQMGNLDQGFSSTSLSNWRDTNKNKFDGSHSLISTGNNEDNDKFLKASIDDCHTKKFRASDSGQSKCIAPKYKSSVNNSLSLHLDTNSNSVDNGIGLNAKGTEATSNDPSVKHHSIHPNLLELVDDYNPDASHSVNGLKSSSGSTVASRPSSSGSNTSCSASYGSQPSLSAINTPTQPEPSENVGSGSVLPSSRKPESCQLKFRKMPVNDIEKALAKHTTENFVDTSASGPLEDCSICLSSVKEESPYQSDIETARDLVGSVQLQQCGHLFHTSCLLQSLTTDSDSICCPNCKTIHGTMTGIQPKGGSMSLRLNPYSLPGHDGTRTILITYSFPRGVQGPEHPSPGRPYYLIGFPRTAYLPDTPQGRKVLRLLREAFNRRLIFTVGTSATLNQSDCVVWNGIHHKTETTNYGGHGYPDPKYLDNVTMELAAVGVTEENCITTSGFEDDSIDDGLADISNGYGGASGSSADYGGASGSSANYGGASGSSANYGGASGSSANYGGASGSSANKHWKPTDTSTNASSGLFSNSGGAAGVGNSSTSGDGESTHLGFVSNFFSKLSVRNKTSLRDESSAYQRHSSGEDPSLRQIRFRTKPKNDAEKLLANCSFEVPAASISDVQCSVCRHDLGAEGPSQCDRLTQRDIVGAAMLSNCGHSFHCCCLFPMLKTASKSFKCPMCSAVHGTVTGTQPRGGKMTWETRDSSLPGHKDCGTIVIKYFIPKGKQGPEHPHPGRPYHVSHFPRWAYLPDTRKGRQVLALLKKAFDRRLIFTVGYSDFRMMEDCVTWDKISHKTSLERNSEFGYPDPKYLDTVLLELAVLGVTERS